MTKAMVSAAHADDDGDDIKRGTMSAAASKVGDAAAIELPPLTTVGNLGYGNCDEGEEGDYVDTPPPPPMSSSQSNSSSSSCLLSKKSMTRYHSYSDDLLTPRDDDDNDDNTGPQKRSILCHDDTPIHTNKTILTIKSTEQMMQPILSSLLLSSIREDEGEVDNSSETTNNTKRAVDPNDPNESHHRVMHAVVDTTLQVMDYIEDEIDTNTYNNDEFVPLQLRLAIEDQIFGWDHFLSSLLGHVGYTVGSYLLMYWFVTFIVLHQLPWTIISSHDDTSSSSSSSSNNNNNLQQHPWGIPCDLFALLRTLLSTGSAISTFRTVRRRRRVWLPRASSSAAVRKEADFQARRFVLGTELWNKMRRSYKKRRDGARERNVRASLEKAERLFEHRRRRLRSLDDGEMATVGLTRNISALSLMTLSFDDDEDNVANDNNDDGRNNDGTKTMRRSKQKRLRRLPVLVTSLVSDSSCCSSAEDHEDGDDDIEDETDESTGGGSSIGFEEEDAASSSSRKRADRFRRMDSHTLPNFAIESVSHDQMPFAHGEITQIPYVHGVSFSFFFLCLMVEILIIMPSLIDVNLTITFDLLQGFFGAAPFMLTNPHWISILRRLMPDVYVEISRRAAFAAAPKLIHWAENNPVVAAYGTAHEIEFSGKVPILEWDVFLDPYLVRRVEIVLSEKESFVLRQKNINERTIIQNNDVLERSELPINDERLVLSYYDKEIARRTAILCERMLIAHGNVVQLVMEQIPDRTGYFKRYNFSRVKRTRKTLGGGIYAQQWIQIYSEAMKQGMGYDDNRRDSLGDVSLDGEINDSFGGPPSNTITIRKSVNDEERKIDDRGRLISSKSMLQRSTAGTTRRRTKNTLTEKTSTANSHILEEQEDPTSLQMEFKCNKSIVESISTLKLILKCSSPLGILLDMKSRHVSRRVWALVVDYLRASGVRVEGIASFFVEEVRDITQLCTSPVNEIIFIHSAGDLQRGCHLGNIRRGDRVLFNAGSLLWDYPNVYDTDVVRNIMLRFHPIFDEQAIKEGYRLKPYAKTIQRSPITPKNRKRSESATSESETCDDSTFDDGDSTTSELFNQLLIADTKKKSLSDIDFAFEVDDLCSTIQQYKDYYQLSIGLYVQEFAIDEVAISLIAKYVNSNLHVYDLGLSWGGLNGLTVKGIQPGRFTATDGLWNQRYTGMPWKKELQPGGLRPTISTNENEHEALLQQPTMEMLDRIYGE